MTLDLRKYIKNLIEKEAKISHFSVEVSVGKKSQLKEQNTQKLKDLYGESFLNDADYIIFFKREEGWDDKGINTIFELTDRALGKSANSMNKEDFLLFDKDAAKEETADESLLEDNSIRLLSQEADDEDELLQNTDDTADDEDVAEEPEVDDEPEVSSSKVLFMKITIK